MWISKKFSPRNQESFHPPNRPGEGVIDHLAGTLPHNHIYPLSVTETVAIEEHI